MWHPEARGGGHPASSLARQSTAYVRSSGSSAQLHGRRETSRWMGPPGGGQADGLSVRMQMWRRTVPVHLGTRTVTVQAR